MKSTAEWLRFPVVLVVKNLPASAGDEETWVWSLGQEDPLEEEMATHSTCLENPMDRGARRASVHWVTKSQTRLKQLSTHTCMLSD